MEPKTTPIRAIGGRYRLIEPLGAGGMGRVWRAHDQQLGVDVAIKEVFRRPGIADDFWNELLIRARREARHGAKLRDHPNIVAVFDVVVEDSIPWTVMRLVKGTSLESRLKQGPLPVQEAQKVAASILSALDAAHAAGIVHRDVKPANIMLADNGNVLLTDFGIAVNDTDTKLTEEGGIIGSMAYIAPERADGHQGTASSDLFSLGATLYQATEGTSPFERDTLTGTLRAVAFHEPPPPARAGHLAPLITALLDKTPANRPTIAKALAMTKPGNTTKKAPPPTEEASFFDVLIEAPGDRKIHVINALKDLTGKGLKESKDLLDTPSRPVLTRVNWRTAIDVRTVLEQAGATVTFKVHDPQATYPDGPTEPTPTGTGAQKAQSATKEALGCLSTLAVLVLIGVGLNQHWWSNLLKSMAHNDRSPNSSVTPYCFAHCDSAYFIESGSQFAGTCSSTSGCPVSGTFVNDGRRAGGASVTFSLTGTSGVVGRCTTPLPSAAPNAVVTASCTVYPPSFTGTVHLTTDIHNPL
ncbi:ribosomal protein L7/L12 [Kitasatospora sp. NPDC101183]|uniref:ribosomal protein L7/L12 n=1 Tax=Kitasatospora sp. NPDC101183 TaxID=3364100 RepID=UPI0037F90FD7